MLYHSYSLFIFLQNMYQYTSYKLFHKHSPILKSITLFMVITSLTMYANIFFIFFIKNP